jgi:hypothetical protein
LFQRNSNSRSLARDDVDCQIAADLGFSKQPQERQCSRFVSKWFAEVDSVNKLQGGQQGNVAGDTGRHKCRQASQMRHSAQQFPESVNLSNVRWLQERSLVDRSQVWLADNSENEFTLLRRYIRILTDYWVSTADASTWVPQFGKVGGHLWVHLAGAYAVQICPYVSSCILHLFI